MKKIISILTFMLVLFTFNSFSQEYYSNEEVEFNVDYEYNVPQDTMNEFEDGWEDGYCEGWKDVKGQYAICPIPPIAPIPYVGRTLYKDGYNRGFKQGFMDAKKDENYKKY